jgi:hypothetical protein
VISGVPTASLGAPVCCHEVNVLPFWLSVQPTGRDGDLLACKDIGRENYRMLSLTLIFRNFHWRHGERIYRRKSPQLSIEAIARYRDQQFESGLLQRRVNCESDFLIKAAEISCRHPITISRIAGNG